MSKKQNAIFNICLLFGIILIFTVADFWSPDRLFSETENRVLAEKPVWSFESFLRGSYTEKYETYVTDQFVGRDKWIGIKTQTDILLQKKTVNGVYLGDDGYLIEQHRPEAFSDEQVEKQLERLTNLVERWDAQVMLVPTADNVLTDKLPAGAVVYNEKAFLDRAEAAVGSDRFIDVYGILMAHRDEAVYYRTDHHWTTLGATYGFAAWCRRMRETVPDERFLERVAVSDSFLGTLHSKVNFSVKPDVIECVAFTMDQPVSVTYDFGRTSDSYYETKYLDTKNQYGYFLDDNHGLVEIRTDSPVERTLFLIKDSYANCMIPMLGSEYQTIYVMDLRYFNGRLFQFMEQLEPAEGMDVLVLYNCVHFLEDFRYYE